VRRGLLEAGRAAALYAAGIVAPVVWLAAPAIARSMAESDVTAGFTVAALRTCPLAVLAMIPFILVRPVFEGMQRGRPGLLIAILRYVVLTVPMAMAGAWVARVAGAPAFLGMIVGLIGATAVASAVFLMWIRAALASLAGPPLPEAAQPAS
jgi:Na+-driven multidrug efflux pump